jgi:hypothetical protein
MRSTSLIESGMPGFHQAGGTADAESGKRSHSMA